MENPGKKALKKEKVLQAPRMRAEGNISHLGPVLKSIIYKFIVLG